jgi:Tfp pilus assembly protein PilF
VALQHLEQAASLKGPVASKYHLAMAYARAGNMERGRATLQAALKVDPNTPEAKMAKEVFAHAK